MTHLPPLRPTRPSRTPPRGAIDSHAHIFGPLDRFPVAATRSYDVFELPAERYLEMLDGIGFSRGVLVTASAYGADNRALAHALSAYPARLRGVAVVTDQVTADELLALRDAGVRGLRFTHLPDRASHFTGTVGYAALKTLAPVMRELGLHAQLWTLCHLFTGQHRELLELGIPLVLDHMGLVDPARGIEDETFQTLLGLLADGRVWIKLVAYRLSRQLDYADVRAFHEAMLAANPDQLVWGSDWPHVRMTEQMPDDGRLVDLCLEWTGDEALVRKVLVDNPARLYGWD